LGFENREVNVSIKDLFQTADWKKEKHVPVIESPELTAKGVLTQVKVSVGKEIPHPNTTEHYIEWIEVYFLAQDAKSPVCLGRCEFSSHGAWAQGPNTSGVYTEPQFSLNFKTDKAGVISAVSYCNIHGLWENSKELKVTE
jgi:superoxide reductase